MIKRSAAVLALVGALAVAGCGSSSSNSTTSTSASPATTPATTSTATATPQGTTGTTAKLSFEGIPLQTGVAIAPASTTGTGTVSGIQCGSKEQLQYHIHAHLTVFVNGVARSVPGGIGIPGSQVQQTNFGPYAVGGQCIYWLHTHAPDGVIHVESPSQRIYTLGDFFDEWHQPLSATQVGLAHGTVTATVNGKSWTKDVRSIPLDPHSVIQLNVGEPIAPFQTVNWNGTGL
jgi:hypothetical protein